MIPSRPDPGSRPREDLVAYRERVEDLRGILVDHGSLGLLLIDTSSLAQIEHQYGSSAFGKVMGMARELVLELKGHEVRSDDVICLNDQGGGDAGSRGGSNPRVRPFTIQLYADDPRMYAEGTSTPYPVWQ